MPKIVTKKDFIERSTKVHQSKYSYEDVLYINTSSKVNIICKEHGIFEQRPYSHMEGRGCPQCSKNSTREKAVIGLLKKAIKLHNNFYDYSHVQYTDKDNTVTIICPKHGPFDMRLHNHVYGKQKCPLCGSGKKRTTKDFITLAREVHGDLYDYYKVDYINAITKVEIICQTHGSFFQTPDSHCGKYQQGCPHCKASKGKRRIFNTLKEMGITNFTCEKTFEDCVGNTNLPLRFDFFLPDHNLLIEFDGKQHYEMVNFSGRITQAEQQEALELTRCYDLAKNIYAHQNNYKLLRIPHWEYKLIPQILRKVIL